jgi:hypothetical protein
LKVKAIHRPVDGSAGRTDNRQPEGDERDEQGSASLGEPAGSGHLIAADTLATA